MLFNKRPTFSGASTKLHLPFEGPFEVVEKKSVLNRVLRGVNNPDDFRLVHVDRLKPFVEREEDAKKRKEEEEKKKAEQPQEEPSPEPEFEVEEILQEEKDGKGKTRYLVKWKGFTARYNTWEPEENLTHTDEVMQRFKQRPEQKRSQPVLNSKRGGGSKSDGKPEKEAAAPPAETRPTTQPAKVAPTTPQVKDQVAAGDSSTGKPSWVPKTQQTRSGRISRKSSAGGLRGGSTGTCCGLREGL
jgi:hypothetical protein